MNSRLRSLSSLSSSARMPRWLLPIGVLAAALVAGLTWEATKAVPRFQSGDPRLEGGDAEAGAKVFAAGQCASCHASPGQPDRLRLGGGLALASPFGTFRAPNLSPHPTDGIGSWTGADLANALIAGVSPNREHYYPVLPYTHYTSMTLTDIRNLFAYLKTLEPVAG